MNIYVTPLIALAIVFCGWGAWFLFGYLFGQDTPGKRFISVAFGFVFGLFIFFNVYVLLIKA